MAGLFESQQDENEEQLFYKMDANPKGRCIIINNTEFANQDTASKPLKTRLGSDHDRDALKSTFEDLGFLVECHENVTATGMMAIMQDVATYDHSDYDCFVCCVLSHGNVGQVYASNGETVEIIDMLSHLKPQNCHTLAGKPKLIFIQACQGTKRECGVYSMERDASPMNKELVPSSGDYLLSYATTPGNEAYRSPERGSIFIQNLTRYLREYSEKEDLLHILLRVNRAVGQVLVNLDDGCSYQQAPAPFFTLRKKVLLGPRNFRSNRGRRVSDDLAALAVNPRFETGNKSDSSTVFNPMTAYEVAVTTGNLPNAKTDARVFITLFGINGSSRIIELEMEFEKSSTVTVKVQTANVAPLKKLRITMDNELARSSSWNLEKIELHNVHTDVRSTFEYNNLLGESKTLTSVDIAAIEYATQYKITVETSNVRGAGTDANVYLILFGVNGDSGELHLKKSETNKNPFEKGRSDVFTFKDILSLCTLLKLRIWHDNKGIGAAWHLASVTVQDMSTENTYIFHCGKWLSASEGDNQIVRELVAYASTPDSQKKVVYEIEVRTSSKKGAGTVHHAWLRLIGSKAVSKVMTIKNVMSTQCILLQRGQTNNCTLTSHCLGELEACFVGAFRNVDCDATYTEGSRWGCSEIVITDTNTGQRFTFPCTSEVLVVPRQSVEGITLNATQVDSLPAFRVRNLEAVMYEVRVFTGDHPQAGTDANVSIIISGVNGDTGSRLLQQSGRNLFERGQMDKFLIEALDLGQLTWINISHDNRGSNPDWFLEKVEIINKKTNNTCVFSCGKWFGRRKEDKQLTRQLSTVASF